MNIKYIDYHSRNITQFRHFDETYQDIEEKPSSVKKPLKSFLYKASKPLLRPFSKSNAQLAKSLARSLMKFSRDF